jgi:hypothetical protein
MRNLDLKTLTFTSSLVAATIALMTAQGCSTGSDTPGQAGAAGTSGAAGTGSSPGAAGTGSPGAAGTGSSPGAAGTGSSPGAAGSGSPTGAAGTGSPTGAAGTGGLTEAPPTTGVCAGMGTRKVGLDQSKVDNFEDGDLSLGWSTFNDIKSAPNSIKMTIEAGGAVGTAHAAHYVGTGATPPTMNGYGVGAIYNVAIDHMNNIFCIDITAFDGVTFWAKGKDSTHHLGVNFVIPQTNMSPEGDCTTGCYNHPQKSIALTPEWQQYSVSFASAMAGTNKVNGRIQELGWLSPEADWDYYIDEIQFYKGTPPTTPAM